jgi:phosphatidylglycerophosphate synthase
MRKIPQEFDNPFDNIFLWTIEQIVGHFHNWGFSPNMITTLSLVFGILSVFTIFIEYYLIAGLCFTISYYFDDMDGFMARKYNMVTTFGDYYDHIKDLFVFVLVAIMIYIKAHSFAYILFVLLPLGILMLKHVGCQEIYMINNGTSTNSSTLKFTKLFCQATTQEDVIILLNKYKWFGTGTFVIATSVAIALLPY